MSKILYFHKEFALLLPNPKGFSIIRVSFFHAKAALRKVSWKIFRTLWAYRGTLKSGSSASGKSEGIFNFDASKLLRGIKLEMEGKIKI